VKAWQQQRGEREDAEKKIVTGRFYTTFSVQRPQRKEDYGQVQLFFNENSLWS